MKHLKMAKTTQSKKAKGSKAEREIAKIFRETGIDRNCRRQLLSGGSYLKGDLNTSIGYTVEIKKQETAKIWEWIKQTEKQAEEEHQPPLLIFGRNNSSYYCVLDLYDFCKLFNKAKKPVDDSNRELNWKINNLIRASKEVIKLIKK